MEDADYRLLSFRWYQGVNLEETVNEGIGVNRDGVVVCMGKSNVLWCDPKRKEVMKWLMRRSVREDWVLMNANEIEHNQVLDLRDSGERDGKGMCSMINRVVGACCMIRETTGNMKGFVWEM